MNPKKSLTLAGTPPTLLKSQETRRPASLLGGSHPPAFLYSLRNYGTNPPLGPESPAEARNPARVRL